MADHSNVSFRMKTLLLLSLLLQDEPIADKAKRLAKDPAANHDAILRLGPVAIRPLLEVRKPELEPLIDELRFGERADLAKSLNATKVSFKVADSGAGSALTRLFQDRGFRTFIDPTLLDKIEDVKIDIEKDSAPLAEIARAVCAKAGVEYGWARGRLVITTPDRLWPSAPVKAVPLTETQVKALQAAAAQLDDDSPETRDQAARDILALGEAAIPHLEKLLADAGAELKAQLNAAIAKLTPRPAAPVFSEKLAIEGQALKGDDAKAVEGLNTSNTFKLCKLALGHALGLLVMQAGLTLDLQAGGANVVTYSAECEPLIDMLYWMTVPYGLDAFWAEGKVVVDTRAKVAEALRKK